MSFEGWYDARLVAAMAAEMAAFSVAAQQTTAGLSASYMTGVAAATGAASGVAQAAAAPRELWEAVRFGADLLLVNHRPAEVYKRAIARGLDHEEALELAANRGTNLVLSDLALEDRAAQQKMLDQLGISMFRRVIRPEMSKTGSCGLCIVASDRIYTTGNLMPIHPPSCKCVVMPIIGDQDPGGR